MRIASINWATIDGALWVLKFYRPARWSDAQIGEEHAFTHELAAAELPGGGAHRARRRKLV